MNNARYVRELDFARFHFYDRTGIYANITAAKGHALQGASSIRYRRTIPIFSAYKVETKVRLDCVLFIVPRLYYYYYYYSLYASLMAWARLYYLLRCIVIAIIISFYPHRIRFVGNNLIVNAMAVVVSSALDRTYVCSIPSHHHSDKGA